jgi:transcriptional regulator with XRE-family HTH domain
VLREILDRNRLDQTQVADGLGISRVSVGNWVHGRSKPSGPNLVRLRDYLRQFEPGLEVEDLLAPAPEPAPAVEAGK